MALGTKVHLVVKTVLSLGEPRDAAVNLDYVSHCRPTLIFPQNLYSTLNDLNSKLGLLHDIEISTNYKLLPAFVIFRL